MAKSENLEYLNDIIGLTLTDVDKEVYVGPYRCDIVAKDETSGAVVIIENQLEATNHDHLGKLITYASGKSADIVIWVVKRARDEHRADRTARLANSQPHTDSRDVRIARFKACAQDVCRSMAPHLYKIIQK